MKLGDNVKITLLVSNGFGGPWTRPREFFGTLIEEVAVGGRIRAVEEDPGIDMFQSSTVVDIQGSEVRTRNSIYKIEPHD